MSKLKFQKLLSIYPIIRKTCCRGNLIWYSVPFMKQKAQFFGNEAASRAEVLLCILEQHDSDYSSSEAKEMFRASHSCLPLEKSDMSTCT